MKSAKATIDPQYFQEYRKLLGFVNQKSAKDFLAAKDILPTVDYAYLEKLNFRLADIIRKVNGVVHPGIRKKETSLFLNKYIEDVFKLLRSHEIIARLNNQGRRPEQVYYSWMRGYTVSAFFLKAIGSVFEINPEKIALIGGDDLINIETFKRTPTADLEFTASSGSVIRIEVQSGFQGINDIKQHKVIEAKRRYAENGILTIAIHFDLYNGQAAFVRLDEIENDSINWITRQQMEGQTVFNIDQNLFIWKLTELPPHFTDCFFDLC